MDSGHPWWWWWCGRTLEFRSPLEQLFMTSPTTANSFAQECNTPPQLLCFTSTPGSDLRVLSESRHCCCCCCCWPRGSQHQKCGHLNNSISRKKNFTSHKYLGSIGPNFVKILANELIWHSFLFIMILV